ncbi:extensin, partial [Streptomyces geysiriensis]|nr:extensin [Streptomyces geysiriensis]
PDQSPPRELIAAGEVAVSSCSTPSPAGGFDPRELTDFQLDELVHRIIGRVTRLVRTELRMDRERVGRLRDPRA